MPTHKERKYLPYSKEQMYALVADVESYPKFLPWLISAEKIGEKDGGILYKLTAGKGFVKDSFVTLDYFEENEKIDVFLHYGPFKTLTTHWKFIENEDDDGCHIDFFMEYEFTDSFLSKVVGGIIATAAPTMITSFIKRAKQVYG